MRATTLQNGEGAAVPIAVGAAVALVVLLVLQSVIGSGLFSTKTVTSTTTVTTTSTVTQGPLVFFSQVSQQGLQLKVVLNSSSIPYLGTIGSQIELVTTNDNVTLPVPGFSMQETVEVWNGYDYVCGENPSNSVLAYAVFSGHYSSGNVSSAGLPLQVGAPFFPPCANGGLYPSGHSITFSSEGVNARLNVTNGYCVLSPGQESPGNCGLLHALVGYWNRTAVFTTEHNDSLTSSAFVHFPPGEYTIAATDLWNQFAYATFIVQSEPE